MRRERGLTERGRRRHASERMPAAERRAAVLDAALEVFSAKSYSSATTAEIARAAGVSEPILYRHFASKRDLWLACLDAAWAEVRAAIDAKMASVAAGVPGDSPSPWESPRLAHLWLQGIAGSADDPTITASVRSHMRDVHDAVAAVLRAQQANGGIPRDRDCEAEAWLFVAGGLLRGAGDRLGLLTRSELTAIGRERSRWLTGRL
ncbi:MAG: helix-turn-helix domain-containing protein [Gaiellales bacterium]